MSAKQIGVLALQGAIEPHLTMLTRCGMSAKKVTSEEDLVSVDALIIPGGESSTMIKLMDRNGLWNPLINFCSKKPVWGTCAGAILLAKEVYHPIQKCFGVMNIAAERNSYGSQRESFKAEIEIKGLENKIEADFIRAPRIRPLSISVEVLAFYGSDAVLMKEGKLLVSSFHVELGQDTSLHKLFLESV